MQTRQLGNTDLNLTTIGLGTWAIGGGDWNYGWGPQNDADSIAAIQRALDLGINWIDTAAAYGLGHAEEIVARAIKGRREKVIIATKCGLVWDEASTNVYGRLKAASVRKEAEASLRRLNVDVIDLYQIHWPNPKNDIEEACGVIADLIKEGKVRYGGVSNFSVAQIKRMQVIHPVTSLQPPYSMIERGVEKELLPYCAQHNIGVICYSPMQAGVLTDNFSRERVAKIADEDWRKTDDHFIEPTLSANLKLVEGLRAIGRRHGRPTSHLAIAWVLRRPEVTAAIVGARRPSQIEETAAAGDWQLSSGVVDEIDELLTNWKLTLSKSNK
jgi:aryl-alcohol dehydrogenase-like predicted oxidoreductase